MSWFDAPIAFEDYRLLPADLLRAWRRRWPNFSLREIGQKARDLDDRLILIQPRALDALQDVRGRLGVPMVINSGYRSPRYNERIGGATRSKHVQGIAFDVSMTNQPDVKRFYRLALAAGFRGFGFYPPGEGEFMHIDLRTTGAPAFWGRRWF